MAETTPNAEDLRLLIDNDRTLYDKVWTPITKNLTAKKANDTYDRDKAAIAYAYLVVDGARQYEKENPGAVITAAVKRETAESLRNEFEIEHSLGNYTHMEADTPTSEQKEFMEMCYKIGMQNGWCSGRYAEDDGDYIVEEDHLNRNSFTIFSDLEKLKEDMARTNWCLGSAFMYHDLCFINQVDGGGEWLTIKRFGMEAIAFESMSMHLIISDGRFEATISRLEAATKEQCQTLNY